jgi:hypothetical protein
MPGIDFQPLDPNNPDDLEAATAAEGMRHEFDRNNDVKEIQKSIIYHLQMGGRALMWTHKADSEEDFDDEGPKEGVTAKVYGCVEHKVPIFANNQKEYWSNLWRKAYNNVPRKIIASRRIYKLVIDGLDDAMLPIYKQVTKEVQRNVPTDDGKAPTLMLLLGKPKKSKNGVTKSNHRHWQRAVMEGTRPRDPEVRRKLEIIAGPHGNLLAYQKLKELTPKVKYEAPG